MVDASEISTWITQLTKSDQMKRAAAAEALRNAAFERCFSRSNDWIRDREFLALTRTPATNNARETDRQRISFVAGIAVQPNTFEQIRAANGSPRLAHVPPDQDAIEFELHFGAGADLDILTTRDPAGSGTICRYLQKFGEGIQQVEVNVTDVDRATQVLRARFWLVPIYPATRPGADGTRVNFFLAPAADGTKCLIELVQPAETG
jgi:hypothetical protein